MQITIAAIGKARQSPEQSLMEQYIRQTGWKVALRELQVRKNLSGDALKEAEAALLLEAAGSSVIVALDERGKLLTSPEFSAQLIRWQDAGEAQVTFCIGGADGLAEVVRRKARLVLGFGAMTWPHMLVRAMLAEQLYRAWTISTGHPYHRA